MQVSKQSSILFLNQIGTQLYCLLSTTDLAHCLNILDDILLLNTKSIKIIIIIHLNQKYDQAIYTCTIINQVNYLHQHFVRYMNSYTHYQSNCRELLGSSLDSGLRRLANLKVSNVLCICQASRKMNLRNHSTLYVLRLRNFIYFQTHRHAGEGLSKAIQFGLQFNPLSTACRMKQTTTSIKVTQNYGYLDLKFDKPKFSPKLHLNEDKDKFSSNGVQDATKESFVGWFQQVFSYWQECEWNQLCSIQTVSLAQISKEKNNQQSVYLC